MSAGEVAYRYGERTQEGARRRSPRSSKRATKLDSKNLRVASLLERIYRGQENWAKVAEVLESAPAKPSPKDERAASLIRLGRVYASKLEDEDSAVAAYERVLDLWPGNSEAMSFLSEHFSKSEQWDTWSPSTRTSSAAAAPSGRRGRHHLPDRDGQLAHAQASPSWPSPISIGSGARAGARRHALVLPRVLRRARRPRAPAHHPHRRAALAGRRAREDRARHRDRQARRSRRERAEGDRPIQDDLRTTRATKKRASRSSASTRRPKGGTRSSSSSARTSSAPRRRQTAAPRVLREIAAVYRDRIKSDTALVTVLTQIVQLDDRTSSRCASSCACTKRSGVGATCSQHQRRSPACFPPGDEKAELFRSVARRWLEQFSNVQNATEAYEALLAAAPGDEEAISKLKELYTKRRAWAPLYGLYEKQAEAASGERAARSAGRDGQARRRAARSRRRRDPDLQADPRARSAGARRRARFAREAGRARQGLRDRGVGARAAARARRSDDAARLAVLQKLGGVYAERLADHAGAAKTWRRVLEIQPGHPKALRVLRDAYLAEQRLGRARGALRLAERLGGARRGPLVGRRRAGDSGGEGRPLVPHRARSHRQDRRAERAFRSYERVLSVRPDDASAAARARRHLQKEEKWARLPALYEILLNAAEDRRTQARALCTASPT